jgi:hypothetical protein
MSPNKTNICCFDLDDDSLNYFKSLGFNVFEGSLGSVFTVDWNRIASSEVPVISDGHFPQNIHEYHVFVHDMCNANKRKYIIENHVNVEISDRSKRHLECERPVSVFDIRPYSAQVLKNRFSGVYNGRQINIVFAASKITKKYKTNQYGVYNTETIGPFSNYAAWGVLSSLDRCGNIVYLEDNDTSRILFEGKTDKINYYQSFHTPTSYKDGVRGQDERFTPLLHNELNECVSYIYYHDEKHVDFVFPHIDNKADFLRTLFEEVIFKSFSEFFPDIEEKRWVYSESYDLPGQKEIREKIKEKEITFTREVEDLKASSKQIDENLGFLKDLLTESGDKLVSAVKKYLERLGFENVVDKDATLNGSDIKEEDLNFTYGNTLVLVEVKGINGTSTDAECSQVDKIVNRRMRQNNTVDVHGIYIVNNEKNVDPLKRTTPPFNANQIGDAKNQFRTIVYTEQLFALYFDIEHGYISKDEAKECFLNDGLIDFHSKYKSLGIPYHYYNDGAIVCVELDDTNIKVGDSLYYFDELHRLVGLTINEVQQDKKALQEASDGKTSLNVGVKVPRNKELFVKKP